MVEKPKEKKRMPELRYLPVFTSFNRNMLVQNYSHAYAPINSYSHLQCAMKIGNFWWWELKLPEWEISCDDSLMNLLGLFGTSDISGNNCIPYESFVNCIHTDDQDFLICAIDKCIKTE